MYSKAALDFFFLKVEIFTVYSKLPAYYQSCVRITLVFV